MRQSGTHMDEHLKHDANCYISVCGDHYADLVSERDALREVLSAVIDEGVVNWHDASNDTRHVHEALGLTFEQYAAWVERDWPKFVKACPE